MATLQFKDFHVETKEVDNDQYLVKAIVSVFNVPDRAKEVVMYGYFSEDAEVKSPPPGVWAHDMKQPVAKTLSAKQLEPGHADLPDSLKAHGGLEVLGKFNSETQRGREAFSDIKEGIIDNYSFGYVNTKVKVDESKDLLYLYKGMWLEWSPVVAGCHPMTTTVESKGFDPSSFPIDLNIPAEKSLSLLSYKDCFEIMMENDRRLARLNNA